MECFAEVPRLFPISASSWDSSVSFEPLGSKMKDISTSSPVRMKGSASSEKIRQLEAEAASYESSVPSKPNQAFKGLYVTAQALLKEHAVYSGCVVLHKLLYFLQQTVSSLSPPFMTQLTTGRCQLIFKTCMIIARLLQIPQTQNSTNFAIQYCTRAIACFFNITMLHNIDNIHHYPLFHIESELAKLYPSVRDTIPCNYSSKVEKKPGDTHDIYNVLYPMIMEVAAINSYWRPQKASLTYYILAYAIAKLEKKEEDYHEALENIIRMRDYLAYQEASSGPQRIYILKKIPHDHSLTYFKLRFSSLENMRGKFGSEERMLLFHHSRSANIFREVLIIALAQQDPVLVRNIMRCDHIKDFQNKKEKSTGSSELLFCIARFWLEKNIFALLGVQSDGVYDELLDRYEILKFLIQYLIDDLQ